MGVTLSDTFKNHAEENHTYFQETLVVDDTYDKLNDEPSVRYHIGNNSFLPRTHKTLVDPTLSIIDADHCQLI